MIFLQNWVAKFVPCTTFHRTPATEKNENVIVDDFFILLPSTHLAYFDRVFSERRFHVSAEPPRWRCGVSVSSAGGGSNLQPRLRLRLRGEDPGEQAGADEFL